MTTQEQRHFQDELTHQRCQILARAVHRVEPDERVGADGVPDFADYAADRAEADVADRIAGSEANLLSKIDLALGRLEVGTYETCTDCGGGIPLERLKAKPAVSLCMACQEKKEAPLA